MTTLFDIPVADVLFSKIFSRLELPDVWRLRLVCKGLHNHCWDYFTNDCTSLSVITVQSPPEHTPAGPHPCLISSLGVGPGVSILRRSRRIRDLRISSPPKDLAHQAKPSYFPALLKGLVSRDADCNLKKLSLRGVSLEATTQVLEQVSMRCRKLEELEVSDLTGEVQTTLPALMAHCNGGCLHRLSITDLTNQPLTYPPLPTLSLQKLRYFSVAGCREVSSEGCMEEVFRKCPLLEEVDLRQVGSVRDRTLLVLTEYCRHLKRLFVEGCWVTEEVLGRLRNRGVDVDVPLRTSHNRGKKIPGQI